MRDLLITLISPEDPQLRLIVAVIALIALWTLVLARKDRRGGGQRAG